MYVTEGNGHHISILEHLLNYQQPHEHIHLTEKKPVLWYPKVLFSLERNLKLELIENSRIITLTCFNYQTNKTVVTVLF